MKTLDAIQHEFDQGYRWRSAWLALANKVEPNRLQSKQDRIEHRAILSNGRIGKAMRAADALREAGRSDVVHSPTTPLDHPMAESERPKFEACVKRFDPHTNFSRNNHGYEDRDLQKMFVGWVAGRHCA